MLQHIATRQISPSWFCVDQVWRGKFQGLLRAPKMEVAGPESSAKVKQIKTDHEELSRLCGNLGAAVVL